MALLRQCLQQLRVRRGEWDATAEVWPESDQPAWDDSLAALPSPFEAGAAMALGHPLPMGPAGAGADGRRAADRIQR
ncbi:hypothetical protein GCM10027034_33270 [Ramlibacter solisilvae]|uniref:Uncharacterized protein n=1 Tax=Ramlibacter tataouinensis TaxID=94132 RepID=A0A127JS93_9BURK|nr:hypothetical protein [Ramlibacter tataouinensis]AMO22846.1 hypothetical protein UC35_08005 [Ramlibacter tataouinensis]